MRVLQRLFDVRPGERRRAALVFVHVLLVITAYTMTKAARDALFLSRFAVVDLSWLMIALALSAGVILTAMGRAALLARRNVIIATSHALVAGTLFATWAGLLLGAGRWLAWVFYLWSAVFGVFLVAQAWLLANDLFDPRAARRLWGPIGTGGILGGILGGWLASFIARIAGAVALLPVVAVTLLAAAAVASWAWRSRREIEPTLLAATEQRSPEPAGGGTDPRWREAMSLLRSDRYVRLLAACLLVSTVCYTLLDWQFKGLARISFHGRQDDLAHFFGRLYSWVSVVALIVQIGITTQLLPRVGVAVGLYVLPVVDIATCTLLGTTAFTAPTLAAGLGLPAVAKVGDQGLRYSIDKSSMELLWLPVPTAVKSRAKPFIDTVIDRLGGGLTGILWICLAHAFHLDSVSHLRLLGILVAALAGVWLALVARTRRRYVRAFRRELGLEAGAVPPGLPEAPADAQIAELPTAGPGVRRQIFTVLAQRHAGGAPDLADPPMLATLLDQELSAARRHGRALAALGGITGDPLERTTLASALEEALHSDASRILSLCALLHPGDLAGDILAAGSGFVSARPRRRASAMELLDNTLRVSLRRRVIPVLECLAEPAAGPDAPASDEARRDALQELALDEDRGLAALARSLLTTPPVPAEESSGYAFVVAVLRLLTEATTEESA